MSVGRSRRSFHRGTEMQSCGLFSGSKLLSKDLGLEEEFEGGPRCQWEGPEEEFKGGPKMQSCGIGLLGLLVSLYEVAQNSANRGIFSRTTAPGRLGKVSICAALHHFVNRNQEEFKGGREMSGGMV